MTVGSALGEFLGISVMFWNPSAKRLMPERDEEGWMGEEGCPVVTKVV